MDKDIGGLLRTYRKKRDASMAQLKDRGGRINGKAIVSDAKQHSGKSVAKDTNTSKNYGGR